MIPSHDQRHFFLEIQWQEVLGAKCSEHRPGGHGQLLSCLLLSGAKLSAPHVTLKSPYLWTQATSAPPGFPGSPAGKESTCHAGDPGSIPGSGSSPGEGIGYRLQYSWASLVAQLVKSLPAMWETQVEKGTGLENSMDWMYSPWGHKESDTTERLSLSCTHWGLPLGYLKRNSVVSFSSKSQLLSSICLLSSFSSIFR